MNVFLFGSHTALLANFSMPSFSSKNSEIIIKERIFSNIGRGGLRLLNIQVINNYAFGFEKRRDELVASHEWYHVKTHILPSVYISIFE